MNDKPIELLAQRLDEFKCNDLYYDLELTKEKNLIDDLYHRLNSYKFKIGVIGEFSTGKSTLINSILGRELLPASFIPTTNQITYIKGGDKNYVQITGDNDTKELLSSDNIVKLSNNSQDKSIDIVINNQFTDEYTIIDTPGTNDPSRFSDEIVFDLVGSVDIVIFTMKIDQALKHTEIEFISQLIKKKDIEKFFFVLNFSDEVNEPITIKNEVVAKLHSILNLDMQLIKEHTFIMSSKNSLEAKLSGNMEDLNYTGYNILIENLTLFIKNNKLKLLNEATNLELFNILNSIYLKIQVAIDKLNGNDKLYLKQIETLSQNIEEFKNDIESQMIEFNQELEFKKTNYKNDIRNGFKKIKEEIKEEIKESKLDKFVGTRYLELRTKKLIEDSVEDCSSDFTKEVEKIVSDFDLSLKDIFSDRIVKIDSAIQTNIGKTGVEFGALAGAGALGVLGVSAAGTAYSTIAATTIGSFTVLGHTFAGWSVGTLLAPIAGTLGVAGGVLALPFLLPIAKIAWDTGKWGVDKVGDAAKVAEEKILKEKYIYSVGSSIDKVMKITIDNIDTINSSDFMDNYIDAKFPQKKVLENKIKVIESKKADQRVLSDIDKDLLLSFQESLKKVL